MEKFKNVVADYPIMHIHANYLPYSLALLGLELLPTPTSPTPKSWTLISPRSGLLLTSPLNITPKPFAPFPTARNVSTSGVGG